MEACRRAVLSLPAVPLAACGESRRGRRRRPPDLHFVFHNDVTAPQRARAAVQSLLGGADDSFVWEVTLATSELVTNVITHTALGGEMSVWNARPGIPLRIEVHDYESTRPHPAARRSAGGRGLELSSPWRPRGGSRPPSPESSCGPSSADCLADDGGLLAHCS